MTSPVWRVRRPTGRPLTRVPLDDRPEVLDVEVWSASDQLGVQTGDGGVIEADVDALSAADRHDLAGRAR